MSNTGIDPELCFFLSVALRKYKTFSQVKNKMFSSGLVDKRAVLSPSVARPDNTGIETMFPVRLVRSAG